MSPPDRKHRPSSSSAPPTITNEMLSSRTRQAHLREAINELRALEAPERARVEAEAAAARKASEENMNEFFLKLRRLLKVYDVEPSALEMRFYTGSGTGYTSMDYWDWEYKR